MKIPLNRLSGSAPSYESVGWGVSAVVHAAGVLVAWATCAATVPTERPELLGHTTRVELMAAWVDPQQPTPAVEIVPLEPRVLVTPNQVRIAERTYGRTSTDVSQPTPAELAMADHLMTLPATAVRRHAVASPDEAARTVAPLARPARPRKPARIPTVMAEFSASVVQHPSVGTSDRTPPQLLENRPPTYPAQAVVDRREGTVLLRFRITFEGRVARLEIISSSGHPILDAAAVRAVRTWRFIPARHAGRPVAATVRLPVRFALEIP